MMPNSLVDHFPLALRFRSRAQIHGAKRQAKDGGWSGNPYLQSDAYSTGKALYALHESGVEATDRAYQRGVDYLLSTQYLDGSWYVRSRAIKLQPYFQSGFPYDHDQWISTAATAWAVMAIAPAANVARTAQVPQAGAQPFADLETASSVPASYRNAATRLSR